MIYCRATVDHKNVKMGTVYSKGGVLVLFCQFIIVPVGLEPLWAIFIP